MIKTANLTGSVSRNAGGLFESVRRLVQSLAESGMEVRVFGTKDEFTPTDLASWSPVTVSAFKPNWLAKFGYSPRFLEELADFDPDLAHTHGIWLYPSLATNRYCRARSKPYLISVHGMLDPWAVRHSRGKKLIAHLLFERAHLQGARCLRALCEAEALAIRQLGLKNPIAVIPNGIDLPKALEGGELIVDSPLRTLIAKGRKVLLYLGRIHPKKGLVNLLKAWAAVQKTEGGGPRTKEWVLTIAGWDQGGHEAELKCLAGELGLAFAEVRGQRSDVRDQRTVVFLGPQFGEDKAACYRACDGFVLPSLSEGLPMVILEAWAHGKPVLMTPQCNLPEGFAGNAAIRVEPTVPSLEAGLRALWGMSESQRQGMGRAGYGLTASRYAWPRVAQEMKGLYEWMLGGGAKPGCLTDCHYSSFPLSADLLLK